MRHVLHNVMHNFTRNETCFTTLNAKQTKHKYRGQKKAPDKSEAEVLDMSLKREERIDPHFESLEQGLHKGLGCRQFPHGGFS